MWCGFRRIVIVIAVEIGLSVVASAADVPARIADEAGPVERSVDVSTIRRPGLAPSSTTVAEPVLQRDQEAVASRTRENLSEQRPSLPPPTLQRFAAHVSRAATKSPTWIAGRLAIVVGLFLGLVAVQKLLLPRRSGPLPAGMIQVCGKVPLDAKQSLHLVRIGQRLLVLLESPQGMQRIAEISDPLEVRRLLEPHSLDAPHGAALKMDQVLSQFRHRENSLA